MTNNSETEKRLNERNWTLLIDAIKEGRVVPVLGDNLFIIDDPEGRKVTVKEFLISKLAKKFGGEEEHYDIPGIEALIEEYNFRNRRTGDSTNIYYEVNQQLRDASIKCADGLRQLLAIGKFPLVLTTSFIPNAAEILGLRGEVDIYKKSSSSDIDPFKLDGAVPLLYCLFGKASNLSKTYMLTEEDLLDYLHFWHNEESRPQKLSRYLSDKFILVLGSDYPDWLFRFFWHSIKNFSVIPSHIDEVQGVVTMDGQSEEISLRRFLSRMQTAVCDNAESFTKELLERWTAAMQESSNVDGENEAADNPAPYDLDIFISYASEDYETAEIISECFKNKGANIWFDRNDLQGGNNYDRVIKTNIERAKRFVPIISKNTLRNERRYFRKEWSSAIEENSYRTSMEYIVPIIIDEADITSNLIPEQFKERHFLNYNSSTFENDIKTLIRTIRR